MNFELPKGEPCFFCEVIDGPEDKGIVEETDLTLTLVNQRQFELGQVYVIPRRHAPTLLDLTDDESTAVIAAIRRVARALVATFDPDGMTLYQNNGVVSMQEVPHFHMHVVPRRRQSSWGKGPPHIARLEGQDRDVLRQVTISGLEEQRLAERIRSRL